MVIWIPAEMDVNKENSGEQSATIATNYGATNLILDLDFKFNWTRAIWTLELSQLACSKLEMMNLKIILRMRKHRKNWLETFSFRRMPEANC